MPVPLSVIGSAMARPEPLISTAAPEVTLVVPEVAPRAALESTWTTPTDTVVVPVYVFVPDSASVPEPSLVRPPVVVVMAPVIELLPRRRPSA